MPIEATVLPSNAALVVFAKGVHEQPPADPRQPDSAAHSPPSRNLQDQGISRAKPLASLQLEFRELMQYFVIRS